MYDTYMAEMPPSKKEYYATICPNLIFTDLQPVGLSGLK